MIALVAQKFISDVAMDAMQFSRMRQASSSTGSSEAARKAASLKVIRNREFKPNNPFNALRFFIFILAKTNIDYGRFGRFPR